MFFINQDNGGGRLQVRRIYDRNPQLIFTYWNESGDLVAEFTTTGSNVVEIRDLAKVAADIKAATRNAK